MKREILASTAQKRGISLDPRTKLALLVSIAVFVLGGSYAGPMQWVMIALSAVPLLLFLAAGRFRGAFLYVLIFGVSLWLEMVALARLEGLANFLAVTIVGIFLRFTPSLAMGYIAMSTTTVSEFLAAMARLHLPQQVAIPLAVIFRFFPTIAEEWHAIGDAMRMRGIHLGGGKVNGEAREGPLGGKAVAMLEYRLVPMMISAVKIGEELSQAALTRGLGAPVKRTNLAELGFGGWDAFFLALCVGAWLVQGWVWLH